MLHTLASSLFLPLKRPQVFAFFADPENLARITPPKMGFRIRTDLPISMHQGTQIDYGIRVFGLPLRWRSLISVWDPPRQFVDVQLAGPYKQWIHTHHFRQRDGGTAIEDEVRYELPGRWLGELAHGLVRRQLNEIFRFRQEAIERILLEG